MSALISMMPFYGQCQRVLEILAIQKRTMPISDLLWRVKPLTEEQLQFALDQIVEDKYADTSRWMSDRRSEIHYKINLRGVRFHADGGYTGEVFRRQQTPISMTNEEKLNAVLRAYVEMGVGKGAYAHEMAKRFNINIPAEEVVMLARHLEGDGYLQWIQLTRITRSGTDKTKEKLTTKDYFTASIKGRMFLESGGYNNGAPPAPPTISHTYNIGGSAVVDHSSGRVGDNAASMNATNAPQEKPIKKHWIIRVLVSIWGWLRTWWLAIVGPALLAWLLTLPSVSKKLKDVLNLSDTDSISAPSQSNPKKE